MNVWIGECDLLCEEIEKQYINAIHLLLSIKPINKAHIRKTSLWYIAEEIIFI